jgi:hypothetical protein
MCSVYITKTSLLPLIFITLMLVTTACTTDKNATIQRIKKQEQQKRKNPVGCPTGDC